MTTSSDLRKMKHIIIVCTGDTKERGAYPVELFMILLDSSGRYLNDSINRTIVSSLFLDFVLDANYRVTFSMQTFDMHR